MGTNDETKCESLVMAEWYLRIQELVAEILVEQEVCDATLTAFEEAYEGEAKEEVTLFFNSLSAHLTRLALFYSKMASFISTTSLTFMENDSAMARNMEG